MKQKLLLIVVSFMFVCAGICTSAYASTLVFDGTETIDFTFDVDFYNGGNLVSHVVEINPYPEPNSNDTVWDDLKMTDRNWAVYMDDTPEGDDYTIDDIFKTKKLLRGWINNGSTQGLLDIAFIFDEIENPDAAIPPYSATGVGLMITDNYGTYNFDFMTQIINQDPNIPCSTGNLFVTASNFAPIPEPATMLLMGFGLLGVAGISRKKIQF